MSLTQDRVRLAIESIVDERLDDMEFQSRIHGAKGFKRPARRQASPVADSKEAHMAELRRLGVPFQVTKKNDP